MTTRALGLSLVLGIGALVLVIGSSPAMAEGAVRQREADRAGGASFGGGSGGWFAAPDRAVVNVPFMFAVGPTVLPAGRYTVKPDADDPTLLRLRSADGREAVVVATVLEGTAREGGQADLAFKKYGNDYVLNDVAIPGESVRMVPMSRSEMERDFVKMASIRDRSERNG